ncbi:MAG: PKD domain-containing protein, partial [Thermoanaerobaculia bacterium]|nr:PKD domain-containing protein [Thermoanaerobaculia bacterium]
LGPIDGSPCDTLGIDNHPLAGWRYDKTGGLGVDFTSVSWYEPTQWQWDFGDPASGASNNSAEKYPSHTFSAPGGYEVCLTVSNQYGNDTKCKMVYVQTVGTSPGQAGEVIVFSPNPTGGELRWSGLPAGETVTVRVFDALGRLRLERETSEGRADLVELADGIYFVALIDKKGRTVATRTVVLAKQ